MQSELLGARNAAEKMREERDEATVKAKQLQAELERTKDALEHLRNEREKLHSSSLETESLQR